MVGKTIVETSGKQRSEVKNGCKARFMHKQQLECSCFFIHFFWLLQISKKLSWLWGKTSFSTHILVPIQHN